MDPDVIRAKYQAALAGLAQNTCSVCGYDRPVLIEGGAYAGIWLECGPLEGLSYGEYAPEIAYANHDIFFACNGQMVISRVGSERIASAPRRFKWSCRLRQPRWKPRNY
jgi:hypothetical protein